MIDFLTSFQSCAYIPSVDGPGIDRVSWYCDDLEGLQEETATASTAQQKLLLPVTLISSILYLGSQERIGIQEPLVIWTTLHKQLYLCLEALLSNGADPNMANSQGQTALHYSGAHKRKDPKVKYIFLVAEPSEDTVRLLLRFNASVNHKNVYGNTPLKCAAYASPLNTLHILLSNLPTRSQRESAPRSRNHKGETLLHFASAGTRVDIVKYLLSDDVGLCISETTSRGWMPLHCLTMHPSGNSTDEETRLIQTLILKGNLVDGRASFAFDDLLNRSRRQGGRQVMYCSCRELQYLEDPVAWGKVMRHDLAPLHIVAHLGAIAIAWELLKHGADPVAEDSEGNSPARTAGDSRKYYSYEDRDVMIKQLLDARGSLSYICPDTGFLLIRGQI